MGRLRPGTSIAAADAAFQTLWPQILRTTADGVSPGFRKRYLTFTSGLDSAASGYSPVRRQFRDALWLLFGLVCLLLVAACATVANLCSRRLPGAGTNWPSASRSAPDGGESRSSSSSRVSCLRPAVLRSASCFQPGPGIS